MGGNITKGIDKLFADILPLTPINVRQYRLDILFFVSNSGQYLIQYRNGECWVHNEIIWDLFHMLFGSDSEMVETEMSKWIEYKCGVKPKKINRTTEENLNYWKTLITNKKEYETN